MRSRLLPILFLTLAFFLLPASAARAVITASTPLKQQVDGGHFIFIAKVQEVLPDKPAMVLTRAENLKGEAPFERMPINLTGDDEAAKGKHTQVILDRVEKDLPILIFANKRGKKYYAFCYTNGTWFQMEGRVEEQEGKELVRWSFLHGEPYLRRTFKGSTAELKKIIVDSVKDKKEPPAPNDKEQPGFGEPIKKSSGIGFPIAVIQLPFLGLIAALAALFPTVFGGLALTMKRWMALLSVASFTSLVYFLHTQFPKWIRWSGIDSMATLWFACALLTTLGALWSARRYRKAIAQGKGDNWQPRKFDRVGLSVLAFLGVGALVYAWATKEPLGVSPWPEVLICLTAVAVGTILVFGHYFRSRGQEPRPALAVSAETVMLWSALFAARMSARWKRAGPTSGKVECGQAMPKPWSAENRLGSRLC